MPEFKSIDFGFRRGSYLDLAHCSIKNGTFNLCTDSGDLFIDIDNKRYATKDIISVETEETMRAITVPYQRIYFARDTRRLWIYDLANLEWKLVNGDVDYAERALRDADGNEISKYYQPLTSAGTRFVNVEQRVTDLEEAVSNINSFEIVVLDSVSDLPVRGATHTIYFVPQNDSDSDTLYDEFIWLSDSGYYEKIGITRPDLSDYYKKSSLYTKTEVDDLLSGKSATSHTHDGRYYQKSEVDDLLAGKSATSHNHDTVYYQKSEVDSKLAGKSATTHTHDDRYYTESEMDTKLAGKSDTTHNHDSAYYKKAEVDSKVSTLESADSAIDTAYKAADLALSGRIDALETALDGIGQSQEGDATNIDAINIRLNKIINGQDVDTINLGSLNSSVSGLSSNVQGLGSSYSSLNTRVTDLETSAPDMGNYYSSNQVDNLLTSYYKKTEVDSKLSGKSDSTHNHDTVYYKKTEVDNLLAGKSATTHTHSWSSITDKPSTYTAGAHTHDDRYYTESEIDTFRSQYYKKTEWGDLVTITDSDIIIDYGDEG